MAKIMALALALIFLTSFTGPMANCSNSGDRRGCCSHHDGVCGCNTSTNMLRCCDGASSPTCSCDRVD